QADRAAGFGLPRRDGAGHAVHRRLARAPGHRAQPHAASLRHQRREEPERRHRRGETRGSAAVLGVDQQAEGCMNLSRADLRRLRGPIGLALLAVAVGAVCLTLANAYRESASQAREASRVTRVAAQERVLRVSEEEREIRENLVDFERMREQGMLGDQNRIDWIESIARIKNNRKLFEIKYRI